MRFNWKRTCLITCDALLCVYLVVALTAFNKPEDTKRVCSGLNIDIQDETVNGFISKE